MIEQNPMYFTLSQVRADFRKSCAGSSPPFSTVSMWRWCTKGLGGIKLRHIRAGKKIMTTPEWLRDFFIRLAEAMNPKQVELMTGRSTTENARDVSRPPDQRERDYQEAERRLKQAGI